MFPEDKEKSNRLTEILRKEGFLKQEIGLAIIDLKNSNPKIFGYNFDHFIYPASVFKIFIGAEVLRQIEIGIFSLNQEIEVKHPNDIDKDTKIFPGDNRNLLKAGDILTVDYLLDLMLSRSDNTASNTLIDLVGRESITENIVNKYGWKGSEFTRKFLDRIKEDKKFRYSETTKTCARHIAEFFYLVETDNLISAFVSQHLKDYMMKWNRSGNIGLSIPEHRSYYRKGGYLENNLYLPFYLSYYKKAGFALDYAAIGILRLLKNIMTKGWAFIRWVNDAGVVTGENSKYVVSIFTVNKQISPYKKFKMKKLAKLIHNFMEEN